MAAMKDMGYMFKWFHDEGYGADIRKLREINPEMKTFDTWLENDSIFSKKERVVGSFLSIFVSCLSFGSLF